MIRSFFFSNQLICIGYPQHCATRFLLYMEAIVVGARYQIAKATIINDIKLLKLQLLTLQFVNVKDTT